MIEVRRKLFSYIVKLAVIGALALAFPVAAFAEDAEDEVITYDNDEVEEIVYGSDDFVFDGGWITKYVGPQVVDLVIPSEINGETVTGIKREVFRNAPIGSEIALGSVTIPASIRHIEAYAFDNCPYLKTVVFEDDSSATPGTVVFYGNLGGQYAAGSSTFQNCKRLEKIVLSNQIKIIPCNFAQDCSALKEVEFSGSVEEIWSSAFANCESLNKVDLSKTCVKRIGSSAFFNTTSVTDVKFPGTLERIDEQAFEKCGIGSETKLGELVIPASVKNIGAWAFSQCKYLEKVTFMDEEPGKIPVDGINFVGNMGGNGTNSAVFDSCPCLQYIKLSNQVVNIGNNFAKSTNSLKTVEFSSSVTTIGAGAFEYCTYLDSIDLSKTKVKEIRQSAFAGTEAVKKIKFPETLEIIGEQAFQHCGNGSEKGLGTLILPASIKKIGAWAFSTNKYLGVVIFTDVTDGNKLIDGIEFTGNMGGNGSYSGVFENCERLIGIRFSNNVKSIGNGFAKDCPKLQNIIFPSDIANIQPGAFYTNKVNNKKVSTSVTSGISLVNSYKWDENNRVISGKEPVVVPLADTDTGDEIEISVNNGENLVPKQKVSLAEYFAGVNKKGVKYEVLPKGVGTYSKGKFTAKKAYDGKISIVAYTKKSKNKTVLKTVVLKEKIVKPVKLAKTFTLTKAGSTISENKLFAEGAPKITNLKSSKTSIASVNNDTKTVTAGSKSGKATISAYFGNVKYTFTVIVKLPKLSCKPVKVGDTKTIVIKNTTLTPTKYRSEDESIATVSQTGAVTGVSKGVTYVYATIDDVEYKCKITVK